MHKRSGRSRRLRSYVFWGICILLFVSIVWDDIADFFLGFLAGFLDMEPAYARLHFGTLSREIGLVVLGLLGVFFYVQIRKRVVKPAEELAESMQKVSQGDLKVRVPVNGGFEFGQMQAAFNFMVGELERAKQDREQQEQRNQQLYAGIAHDLKTPMTMIKGYAKLLGEQEDLSEEAVKRYLETIVEQTENANNLLDSLLAYTKLENQSYTLRLEKKNIAETLRVCVANFYPTMEKADMQVELQIPDETVVCEFDEPEMKRVLLNLLSNMVKHNPKGTKGKICMEKISKSMESLPCVRIVIADNGPQISEELQGHLFETFVVGDSSRNTKNGSGLGLAISKKIVERHCGRLYYVPNWKDHYKAFVIEVKAC